MGLIVDSKTRDETMRLMSARLVDVSGNQVLGGLLTTGSPDRFSGTETPLM